MEYFDNNTELKELDRRGFLRRLGAALVVTGVAPSAWGQLMVNKEVQGAQKVGEAKLASASGSLNELKPIVPPKGEFPGVANLLPNPLKPAKLNMGRWKRVIVHHSATAAGSKAVFDYYHREVVGMSNGLAYHFVIGNGSKTRDGLVEPSRRWVKQLSGGHVRSRKLNKESIGICLVGNFEKTKPTEYQIQSLVTLIRRLKGLKSDNPLKLVMHRDIQATLCPGKNFPEKRVRALASLRPEIAT